MANSNSQNIVQVASNDDSFSTLVAAVKAAGLTGTLSGQGPFTLLAPNNSAFEKVPKDILNKLLMPENKSILSQILTYHVIDGDIDASEISEMDLAETVEGSKIMIEVMGSSVILNSVATVLVADIMASNGIIHCLDTVLIPDTVNLAQLT
jgi:uncharacterized surface protein with fasciclin (FAS1) repeats